MTGLISDIASTATTLAGTEYLEIDAAGTSKKITAANLGNSLGGKSPVWSSSPTAPTSSSFTLVKDAGTTASMTDTTRGVLLSVTGAGAADRNALMEKNTPGSTWTMTALIQHGINWRNYMAFGLYAKDSSTGKIHAFNMANDSSKSSAGMCFRDLRWTNITTFSASAAQDGFFHHSPIWMKLQLDATNLTFSTCTDGENWTTRYPIAKATFLATIDRCGIFFGVNQQTAPQSVAENIHLMGFTLA